MKKHFNITVRGLVHGVNYRGSSKLMAQKLGITGFVKNEPNGDVYAEVEGEEAKLQEFVKWCSRGSERAEVKEVMVKEGEVRDFVVFEVRR